MNITVAGTGYVGLVTGVCLAELGHQVDAQTFKKRKLPCCNLAVHRFMSLG